MGAAHPVEGILIWGAYFSPRDCYHMVILDLDRNIEKEKRNVRRSHKECLLRAEAVLFYFPPFKPCFIADSTVLQQLHHHPSWQVDNLSLSVLLLKRSKSTWLGRMLSGLGMG